MSTIDHSARVRSKEFHFPLVVNWASGRKVTVNVAGKAALDIVPPPEFRGVEPSVWSPEDLFVAAAASCLAVTFTGIAERRSLACRQLQVLADGTAGQRDDGHFGFTRVSLELRLAVAAGQAELAREVAREAEEKCLVSASFDLPVGVTVAVEELADDESRAA